MSSQPARTPAEADDARDIAAARRGDAAAFNRLILRHQDRAYTVAYRYLSDRYAAADAAQQAFVLAYTRLDTFRGGPFGAWLARIVANTALDELRRERRRPSVPLDRAPGPDGDAMDDALPIPSAERTPEQTVLDRELAQAIQACIHALPPDQRAVLVLSDIDEQDYAAIGGAVGVPVGTVKSRLSRARAAMRACLAGLGELLPAQFRLIGKV
jgi:RNA polymerase sigma-70 factor (ECF subfamily)